MNRSAERWIVQKQSAADRSGAAVFPCKSQPTEITEGVGIHQTEQGLTARQQIRKLGRRLLLQLMQPLGQAQCQQSFPLAPVPEPQTWAMMILGFGAVGYLIRRRRARSLVQA